MKPQIANTKMTDREEFEIWYKEKQKYGLDCYDMAWSAFAEGRRAIPNYWSQLSVDVPYYSTGNLLFFVYGHKAAIEHLYKERLGHKPIYREPT